MFPLDILRIIISFVDNPKAFNSLSKASKLFNIVCSEFAFKKRSQFLRKIETKLGYYHVLPNGLKEGPATTSIGRIQTKKNYYNGKLWGNYEQRSSIDIFSYNYTDNVRNGFCTIKELAGFGYLQISYMYVNGRKEGIKVYRAYDDDIHRGALPEIFKWGRIKKKKEDLDLKTFWELNSV